MKRFKAAVLYVVISPVTPSTPLFWQIIEQLFNFKTNIKTDPTFQVIVAQSTFLLLSKCLDQPSLTCISLYLTA